jgi:hypothetical protein
MKSSAYPIKIVIETQTIYGESIVVYEVVCKSQNQLFDKYQNIKSLYKLSTEYQIYFVCNSKVNTEIKKIR